MPNSPHERAGHRCAARAAWPASTSTSSGSTTDQVLVVSADGPIVVGREVYVGGVSLAVGVPFRD